ncbi:response regulator transcription factor [Anaeromicrobium sediminis]|uniref:Stage 0 sporulation protein A homolog n=1 Tax=Anaeromicrobium sediminis TaxID=1478221 RepID=A0A267MBH5_9FIRM|nr:response regulator transcription factor [Anaeromicrobium sediminis]PAB56215.1 DNA-binding response regulator [Anaeromicrobium sediminis]
MEITVLIADDELLYRDLVSDFLENKGYKVIVAKDGSEAIDLFFSTRGVNLVILDVMMPKYDGWEVCKEIRKQSDVPILMLTALGEESNEIHGLTLGADEYISKPFSYEIFMARIKALLRRVIKENEKNIEIEGIIIDQSSQTVSIHNNVIELSPKEYKLLLYLVKNLRMALSRNQILNGVWGYDFFGDVRTVDTHIKSLRSKLGEYGKLIRTVRGLGYEMKVNK